MPDQDLLEILDPDPLDDTVRWSFNDPDGLVNPYGVKCFLMGYDRGRTEVETDLFRGSGDVAVVTAARRTYTPPEMTLRIRTEAPEGGSYDDWVTGVGEMLRLLQGDGRIREQMRGAAEETYIHYLSTPVEQLLRGDLSFLIPERLRDHGPMELRVLRQPLVYGRLLRSDTNKAANPTLLRDINGDGRPDDWAWSSTTGISAESIPAYAYAFTIATAASRDFREAVTAPTAPGTVWTGSIHAQRTSGTSARARAIVEFLNASDVVLATAQGPLVLLEAGPIRLRVTSVAAPANTTKVRVGIRFENSDASANGIRLSLVQKELGADVTPFVSGEVQVPNDPGAGGRVLPTFVHGEAPAQVRVILAGDPPIGGAVVGSGPLELAWLHGAAARQLEGFNLGFALETLPDTSDVSDSGASGGSALAVSFATQQELLMRARVPYTSTSPPPWGRWALFLRVRGTGASALDRFVLQAKAGIGAGNHPSAIGPPHIFSPGTATAYFDVFLGVVDFTHPASRLIAGSVEIWAGRLAGTGGVHLDLFALAPERIGAPDLLASVGANSAGQTRLFSDPETGRVYAQRLDSGQVLSEGGVKMGSLPARLDPGFQALYVHGGTLGVTINFVEELTDGRRPSPLTGSNLVGFEYRPARLV